MFCQILRVGITFFVLCSHLLLFPPVYVLWHQLLKPLKYISSWLYWKIDSILYECMILIVSSWTDQAGHSIVECGADITSLSHKNCIVMVNHQCPSDIGIMMRAFTSKNSAFQRSMWIMDWILQFANFGWVSKGHGDFFLLQPVDAKRFAKLGIKYFLDLLEKQEELLTRCLTQNFNDDDRNMKWLILFPEGGFLSNRRPGSQRYAKKNDLPVLEHVAIPRVGALQVVIKALGVDFSEIKSEQSSAHWDYIVDVTIGYKKPISPSQHMLRHNYEKATITLHYRTFNTSQILHAAGETFEEKLKNWTYEKFYEKEKLLEHFYEHGYFPNQHSSLRHVEPLNNLKYWGIHAFCLLSWFFVKEFVMKVSLVVS